jgi:hypothetical protein
MSRKKRQFNTRLDPDNADRVEAFADERDVTNAEATRRLIRQGLRNYEREQEQEKDDGRERVPEQADSVVRHGLDRNIAQFVKQFVLVALAIFAGGSLWEAGTAFGDIVTLLGVF